MTAIPLILKKTIPALQKWSNPEILKLWLKPEPNWQSSSVIDFVVGGSNLY